jgi:very-short-patch-repair endonuclease
MHGLLPLIGVLTLLGIVAFVIRIALPGHAKEQVAYPYRREPALFTPAERSFLGVLEQALQGQFRVLGKVRLADVIEVESGLSRSARQRARNRIQSKHLDFVVCDRHDLSVQFAVELDDSSHQAPRRQARDEFLDKALAAAGLRVVRFPAKRTYSVRDIRGVISEQSGGAIDLSETNDR